MVTVKRAVCDLLVRYQNFQAVIVDEALNLLAARVAHIGYIVVVYQCLPGKRAVDIYFHPLVDDVAESVEQVVIYLLALYQVGLRDAVIPIYGGMGGVALFGGYVVIIYIHYVFVVEQDARYVTALDCLVGAVAELVVG